MPVSNTIQEFRENVLKKGGPQISAFYEVTLTSGDSRSISCYPASIVFPGRMFTFYDHDIWGPVRKIPYKRGYTQCHMTFIVYQDWAERTFLERWMNLIVVTPEYTINPPQPNTDWVNYIGAIGQINIKTLKSDKSTHTKEIVLKEAFPAAISQMTFSSDGSGYATFTSTFQFNSYDYYP